jgi:hypothetical protein
MRFDANDDGFRMPGRTIELPKAGFAIEIDGRLKTEFKHQGRR